MIIFQNTKGENHPLARLTAADIQAIRSRRAAGEGTAALAAEFRITRNHVSAIVRRGKWKSIG